VKGISENLEVHHKNREEGKRKKKSPCVPNWRQLDYTHHLGMEGPLRRFGYHLKTKPSATRRHHTHCQNPVVIVHAHRTFFL
jgi:hypothetical protein